MFAALVLQLSAISGPAELLIKPRMPYFHGMRKLEARKAHGGMGRGMARVHPTQKHAAVAGGQGNTVGCVLPVAPDVHMSRVSRHMGGRSAG